MQRRMLILLQELQTVAANTVTDRLGANRRTIYSLQNEYPNASDNAAAAATSTIMLRMRYNGTVALYNASTFVTWFSLQNAGVSGRVLIRNHNK